MKMETTQSIGEGLTFEKEADRRLTKLFGERVDYLEIPNLLTKFAEFGFTFTRTNRGTEIADREHGIFTEIDATLENDNKVMIVEAKFNPKIDDINDHIERMEKLRVDADLHNDKRKYLGAVAGVVFSDSTKAYTLKSGFYVIEPSEDTFMITAPEGSYRPREW
jgi:hypothetical protein